MLQLPLILAGLAMGIAATPHCAAMCGAPCAALTQGGGHSAASFHAGRLVGYMAGGAVAAGSVAVLAAWSEASPALRPLWTLLHLSLLALGLWWIATGRPIAGMQRSAAVTVQVVGHGSALGRSRRPVKAGLAGLAWVAWPCGAMQAALLLAALANSAWGGALVMAAFVLGSMPGLAAAPWLWGRVRRLHGRFGGAGTIDAAALGLRVAGVGIVLASGWALTHGLWARLADWCLS